MENKQESLKLLILLVLVIVIGVIFYFSSKVQNSEDNQPLVNPAINQVKNKSLSIIFPKSGDKLEIGKTYEIKWQNYTAGKPLTIGLGVADSSGEIGYVKKISADLSPSITSYDWTVTSEQTDKIYKIGIYPSGNVLQAKWSDNISIIGESLVSINNPKPLEEIKSPIKLTGKARNIFSKGEFSIQLLNLLGGQSSVIKKVSVKAASNCNWLIGAWCDFNIELPFSSLDGIKVVEVYKKSGEVDSRLVYKFPLFSN